MAEQTAESRVANWVDWLADSMVAPLVVPKAGLTAA